MRKKRGRRTPPPPSIRARCFFFVPFNAANHHVIQLDFSRSQRQARLLDTPYANQRRGEAEEWKKGSRIEGIDGERKRKRERNGRASGDFLSFFLSFFFFCCLFFSRSVSQRTSKLRRVSHSFGGEPVAGERASASVKEGRTVREREREREAKKKQVAIAADLRPFRKKEFHHSHPAVASAAAREPCAGPHRASATVARPPQRARARRRPSLRADIRREKGKGRLL